MSAKLYFYYSTMNAGKSLDLIKSAYNYIERGMKVLIAKPKIDTRDYDIIKSRVGVSMNVDIHIDQDTNIAYEFAIRNNMIKGEYSCLLIDEAQFLTKSQVYQLTMVVDIYNIPVLSYGLKCDFQMEPFEGSKYLLTYSDVLSEIRTVCWCGKKAVVALRLDKNGNVIREGNQIEIGGNDSYVAVCRQHWKEGKIKEELYHGK